jgi:hypothetical protein
MAQWRELVPRLDGLHGRERTRPVVLGGTLDPHQIRRRADQRHARGNRPLPAWTGDEDVASFGASGALSGCREDVRPRRQDGHLVVDAVRVGHREDERFFGQVEPGVREQHVHRWRRNSRERRCDRRGRRIELIDRRRELFRRRHIREQSLRAVHDDERKAKDISGFRDLLCLGRCRRSRRGRESYPATIALRPRRRWSSGRRRCRSRRRSGGRSFEGDEQAAAADIRVSIAIMAVVVFARIFIPDLPPRWLRRGTIGCQPSCLSRSAVLRLWVVRKGY